MKMEELRRLQEPLPIGFYIPALATVRIISGETANFGGGSEIAVGADVFMAGLNRGRWSWRKQPEKPTPLERYRLLDWPGIHEGDPVTLGHIDALVSAGQLTTPLCPRCFKALDSDGSLTCKCAVPVFRPEMRADG